MEKLYTVSKTRSRTNCSSDREPLIVKFRLKLKKVGRTIRPLRYDLSETPYRYTVEGTNRLKGSDRQTDSVPEE